MSLTDHFTLEELTRSDTADMKGIDNDPGVEELANLQHLAEVLEQIRSLLDNNPIIVSSGYRSAKLNNEIDGAEYSDHVSGLAVDFTCSGYGSVMDVCLAIRESDIEYDQLIYEQRGSRKWVHLGIGQEMRGEVFSWTPQMGYVEGIKNLA